MMQLLNATASMGETAGFWSIAEAPVLFLFIKCWSSWNSRASTQLRLRGNIGMIVQRDLVPFLCNRKWFLAPLQAHPDPKKTQKDHITEAMLRYHQKAKELRGRLELENFQNVPAGVFHGYPMFFPVIFPMIINDFPLFSTSFHSLSNSSVFVDDYFYGPWMIFSFFFYDFEHDIPSMFHSLSWKNPLLFHDIWPRSAEDLYSAVAGKKDVVEKTLGKRSC